MFLILNNYSINKEKTYEESMEKYHQIKGFYYEARQRHYDNVDKFNVGETVKVTYDGSILDSLPRKISAISVEFVR